MQFWRCKCGESEVHESGMRPHDCQGCRKCNTTLAQHEGGHKPVPDHKPVKRYNVVTREPYHRCADCFNRCGANGEHLGE